MHFRMRKAGYRFFYDPTIISYRKTRSSLKKLIKQKYLNGYWIGRTLRIEPRCFSPYHFVPFLFVLAIIISSLLYVLGNPLLTMLLWGAYIAVNVFISIATIILSVNRNITYLLLPVLFLMLHLSYGIGTLNGIFNSFCIN